MPDTATTASSEAASPLPPSYRPAEGSFDEMVRADGTVREHYRPLLSALNDLGAKGLKSRSETASRIIHEQGITYNVYGDPRGMERPWELDPIPLILEAEEWTALEAGLCQRASLIDRILADCYGPQELIRSGSLPPALVFAQSDFLRPCHGIRPAGEHLLHLYAADLARSPDGRWWVTSDRTQIPTGAGYALANRLVTGRVLPEPFRQGHTHRLAGFFRDLQSALAAMALRRTDNPRVIILTPGPYNETYFEQVWLARYLGYALCEGQDLTVRDDRVFLKTLSGLEPVDVILRRVDDDFCDPLELRNDSMLGVPGLVGALRAGNVAVANTLGAGLLQSPAFMAFLPGLCQQLLGDELKLPSVATWWCGQKTAEKYVLENLEKLYVRPAFRPRGRGLRPEDGNARERETLRRQIPFQPHLFVGQERVEYSTAPALSADGIVPMPVSLRVYLVATPKGYRVMPGGLARVARVDDGNFITMQRGGASKDTWVLSKGQVEEVTLLHGPSQVIELRRVGNNLPSRVADNFFWMGRYLERADATARLLRSTLTRFNPENAGTALPLLQPLLQSLVRQGQVAKVGGTPEVRKNPEALEAELLAAIFDPQRRGSLRAVAAELQRLALLVRDRTSNDLWRAISELDDCLAVPSGGPVLLAGDAVGILNRLLQGLAAFHGLARENMTRAQGWRFLDMGLRIERSIYLCTFLNAALHSQEADNPSILEAVLEVADCTITYRSRYNLLPNIAAVYDLVLLDDTNPRSLLFQLNQLVKHIERLPRERESALPSDGQRVLLECLTRLRLTDPRPLSEMSGRWHASEVGRVLVETLRDMPRLSDAIAVSYFAHTAISRAGATPRREGG
jgi:uncharacterized circularly permuted ATP-grasp superfamily protein/uncharacterized alpha-E superfamily protein